QQSTRGFQSQQAAADDDRFTRRRGALHDLERIIERTKHKDSVFERARVLVDSLNGGNEGPRPGGKDKPVVPLRHAARTERSPRFAIDRFDADARVQRDAVYFVPLERIQEDVLRLVGPGKNTREKNAVVVAIRLVTEDNHVETVAATAGDDLFQQTRSRHPVPDDD